MATEQLALLPRGSSIDERFEEFHAQNPQVYAKLVRLARRAKARGHKRIGMKMLFEVVRWTQAIETSDADFKLNNVWTSRYSRLIQERESDLRGFFETRRLHS